MTLNQMRDSVRVSLAKHHLTYGWLIAELDKRGIVTNKTDMSLYLNGKRVGKKALTVLEKSVMIFDRYEAAYANAFPGD